MTSLSGLQSGDFTDIDVLYSIAFVGNKGENNQVIKSDGENSSWGDVSGLVSFERLNADGSTISIGGSTTGHYDTTAVKTIAVVKVPNALTAGTNVSFSAGSTYDGSSAITINTTDTDTTYQAGNGIEIDTSTTPDTIKAKPDEDTIDFDSDELVVKKVPNSLTAGTNVSFSSGSTYNGSSAITINTTDTNTTYSAGDGLDLTGTTFSADLKSGSGLTITSGEIDLSSIPNSALANDDITIGSTSIALGATSTSVAGLTSVGFGSSAGTTLTGSTASNDPTTASYIDITQDTNVVSPYFLHDVYDPSSADADSLSTSYVAVFSSNLSNTFTAKATTCCIELLIYNYSISGNRWLYLRLDDGYGTEWSAGTYGGGYGTGTRNTERIIHYSDETDKQPVRQTWYLSGLTIGTSYTINPAAKTSATTNYIYAGGSYPASILRGYYLPTSGA